MNNIWYLEHPIYRYEQAVKGLAKEAGLVIVDPENAPADRPGAADEVPAVTLRPEYRQPIDQASAPADAGQAEQLAPKQAAKPKTGKASKASAPAAEEHATDKE